MKMTGARAVDRLGLLAAVVVVLAGCSGVAPQLVGDRATDDGDDRLGVEDGYAATDALSITPADGYNASERAAVLARTMARVERLRGLEFEDDVEMEVISRETYRDQVESGDDPDPTFSAWNDQVWEAAFIVDETTSYADAYDDTTGSSVLAYYSNDRIVLVTDSDTPTIDTRTLAHELVHALQDDRGWLDAWPDTQDAQLARLGLTEGDANLVRNRYARACRFRWDCLDPPRRGGGGGGNQGLLLAQLAPYTEGPGFVDHLETETDGWTPVNDAYDRMPTSTEQVIHPEKYPDETPVTVTVPDRSTDTWHRFDLDQQTDVIGEATIYAMFRDNDVIQDGARYDYAHPLSAGWDGDRVVPYTNGSAAGYVWRLTWDTEADAVDFLAGYHRLLDAFDATRTTTAAGTVRVITDGGFADAFRITRTGRTVTIVNAPTVDALAAVHAPSDGSASIRPATLSSPAAVPTVPTRTRVPAHSRPAVADRPTTPPTTPPSPVPLRSLSP